MSDLVSWGSAVKTSGRLGDISGWLVYFSSAAEPDLDNDYFDSTTDFSLFGNDKRAGFFEHGLDSELGHLKIGVGELTLKPRGVWLDGRLDIKDRRIAKIFDKANSGEMYLSSGSASHLVRRERVGASNRVTSWPLVEWSLTSRPAEPRAKILSVKSLADREALRLQAEVQLLRTQFLLLKMGETDHALLRRAR